jgi:holo-[acyl-carrier protein] synthase
MIYGVGVDLVEIARIESAQRRFGQRLARRLLAPEELLEYACAPRRARYLARRFAAKEALAKALGTGIGRELSWRAISVVHDPRGRPYFDPGTALQRLFEQHQIIASHLSISDERGHALAFVILERT